MLVGWTGSTLAKGPSSTEERGGAGERRIPDALRVITDRKLSLRLRDIEMNRGGEAL